MKKALAENTLVQLVKKQGDLLLMKVLKKRKTRKEPGVDADGMKAEIKKLDEAE